MRQAQICFAGGKPLKRMSVTRRRILRALLFLLCVGPLSVHGSTVHLPIALDYPLLRQVLLRQLFNTPRQTREILNDASGCNQVTLSDPRPGYRDPDLQISMQVQARLGISLFGGCSELLQWQGSAVFLVQPIVESSGTSLRLSPIDSRLVASDGSALTSGRLWDLVRDRTYPLLGRFTLDLSAAVRSLGQVLPAMLPRHSLQQAQQIIDSLRLSDAAVSARGVTVSLSFEVEEPAVNAVHEQELSAEELRQWENRWQMMDALFTFAVKQFAATTRRNELRDSLLDILIDSRYRLRDALTAPATRMDDPVRRWFVDSWQRLNPVVQAISLEQNGQEPLLWISLLAATDALYALDRLGPAIGLEISTDGLRRLARLLNASGDVDLLHYDQAVDPALRMLLQLPPIPVPVQPSGFRFAPWPIADAMADAAANRLDRWAPDKNQLKEYLPLVAELLKRSAEERLRQGKLSPAVAALFRNLVVATAWQESCWRQYVTRKKKLEPLRSHTGDVGLMQINEKVWRGFYDIQKLRWDIAYNSQAGAEILFNYLVKYALKQGEDKQPGGFDNLARASYSAYNGGPSKVSRYRTSSAAPAHKRIDAAFWDKYRQVKSGKAFNVAQCLGGEKPNAGSSTAVAPAAHKPSPTGNNKTRKSASAGALGTPWVLAQKAYHFTLQLAVFSKRESAQRFIAQNRLEAPVAVFASGSGEHRRYTVLYGSFANRSDANRAKQKLQRLKPWARSFGELHKAGKS